MKLGYGKSGNVLLLAGHIQTPCFSLATKKPLNLSIQGLFDIACLAPRPGLEPGTQ